MSEPGAALADSLATATQLISRADWRTVRLGDVCSPTATVDPRKEPARPFFYVDVSSVSNESYRIGEPQRLLGNEAPSRARKLIRADDVIFATVRPTLRRVALVPASLDQQVCSTGFSVLRAKLEVLEPGYLYFVLLTDSITERVGALQKGATYPAINDSELFAETIPLPPLAEQRAIAWALGTVQEAKEARQRELALERERKAALMEFLFTHGTCGESVKQTEIGTCPESWRVVRLGEFCSNSMGTVQTGPFGSQLHASDYREEGIPVVNPTHLGVNTINEERLPRISKEDAERLSRHYLEQGDILISRRGDFSRYSYVSRRQSGWICGTGCLLVRLSHPEVDNFFLAVSMSLEAVQGYLRQASVGSIMPNLNTKILQQMPMLLPPIEEQRLIASVLAGCETKITTLEREMGLLDELFRAMLEELMTGRLSAVPLIQQEAAS